MPETANRPRATYHAKHKRFDAPTVKIGEIYFFPEDIRPSEKREDRPFETQVCYYDRGKWMQDTFYLTQERHDLILSAIPKK